MAKAEITSRRNRPAWTVALLLAFAVSLWGLHYKLSLYHPPAVHVQGPAAKLLSQKERPVASAQPEAALSTGKRLAEAHHPTVAHTLAAWAMVAFAGKLPDRSLLCDWDEEAQYLAFVPARPSAPRAPPTNA